MGLSELRRVFGLAPTKPKAPQIISILTQSTVIFGGPLIGPIAINHYPLLATDRALYIGGIGGVWGIDRFGIALTNSSQTFSLQPVKRQAYSDRAHLHDFSGC